MPGFDRLVNELARSLDVAASSGGDFSNPLVESVSASSTGDEEDLLWVLVLLFRLMVL